VDREAIIARDHELVGHPLFRWIRHPNYYLNILPELTGFALAMHAFGTLLVGLPRYLLVLAMRVRLEEKVMKERFAEY
jgi:isoprenylcysteine carboxyl methyltransferase (ICMT) family protein YpbQ